MFDSATARASVLVKTGGFEALEIGEAPIPEIGVHQVLIQNRAAGVNAVDLLIRRGELPPALAPPMPHVLGVEGAGVIAEVGAEVKGLAVGDRVLWFGEFLAGGYGGFTALDATYVAKIDDSISFATAAAAPVIYATARHMLADYRQLAPGAWILVRSAAGGVGSAVLQLAKAAGLRAIAVTTADKLDFALAQGATAALDYKNEDVTARVREITGGGGVALALNPVAGATIAQDLDLLEPLGQLINYGFMGGLPEGTLAETMPLHFNKSVGYHVSDIYTFYAADPRGMNAHLRAIAEDLAAHRIAPPVFAALPLSDAGAAHQLLESGVARGKIVLTHEDA